MTNVKIHLIGGEIITIERLKSIKTIQNAPTDKIYDKDNFDEFLLYQNTPYVFVSDSSIFAISGSNILYIEFSSD